MRVRGGFILPVKNGLKGAMPVRRIAVGEELTLLSVIKMLPVGAYAVVSVADSAGRIVADLDEAAVISAAKALGAAASMRMAVAYTARKMV